MSVPAWKWLLTAVEEELLTAIAKSVKVRIPGFRESNWDKSVKLLRPRIVQDMLATKKLSLLNNAANIEVQKDPDMLALRELTEQQLSEKVPGQLTPTQVLLSLLSSPEEAIAELGESLYQNWEAAGLLAEWQQAHEQVADAAEEQVNGEQMESERYREQLAKLEAQLRKREKKMQKLAANLAKQKTSATRARRRWQQERKQLANQLAGREAALNERDAQLAEQTATLSKQAELIAQLKTTEAMRGGQEPSCQTDETYWESGAQAGNLFTGEAKNSRLAQKAPTIAVVGNLQRVNIPPEEHAGYRLLHVSPKDIQSGQAAQVLQAVDQVWLLTYATPLPLQRRLRQLVPQEILYCFATYQDYMHDLGQGV